MNRRSVERILCTLGLAALLLAPHGPAAAAPPPPDFKTTITEEALDALANVLLPLEGHGSYYVARRACQICDVTLREVEWDWILSDPHFEITPSGCTLRVTIDAASEAHGDFHRTITIPVELGVNPQTANAELKLVDYPVLVTFEGYLAGTLNPSTFFRTRFPIRPASMSLAGRRITATLVNPATRMVTNAVEVTGNIRF